MTANPYYSVGDEAEELRAENKRLRAALAESLLVREERDQAIRERDSARGLLAKADGAIERLRLQVVALENAGLETAAQLGEAEEEIARLRKALRRAVDMLYRDDWTPEDRDALDRLAPDEDRRG